MAKADSCMSSNSSSGSVSLYCNSEAREIEAGILQSTGGNAAAADRPLGSAGAASESLQKASEDFARAAASRSLFHSLVFSPIENTSNALVRRQDSLPSQGRGEASRVAKTNSENSSDPDSDIILTKPCPWSNASPHSPPQSPSVRLSHVAAEPLPAELPRQEIAEPQSL